METQIKREVYEIAVGDISVSKHNVRKDFDDEKIEELAQSIKQFGQLQPVLLIGNYGKPPYELIVGQRRYTAISKLGGKHKVLAVFTEKKLQTVDAIVISLAENLQRSNLTFEEMSNAISKIYDHYKNVKDVARVLGISLPTVYDYIKIEKVITPEIKEYASNNKISKTDIQRAIQISKGDNEKIINTLKELKNFTKYQKDRAMDFREENPDANASDIIQKAKTPKVTNSIVLSLSKELNAALEKATKALKEDSEVIALKALRSWLTDNGFIE